MVSGLLYRVHSARAKAERTGQGRACGGNGVRIRAEDLTGGAESFLNLWVRGSGRENADTLLLR